MRIVPLEIFVEEPITPPLATTPLGAHIARAMAWRRKKDTLNQRHDSSPPPATFMPEHHADPAVRTSRHSSNSVCFTCLFSQQR